MFYNDLFDDFLFPVEMRKKPERRRPEFPAVDTMKTDVTEKDGIIEAVQDALVNASK